MGTPYAQLTHNGGNDDDGPEIWVTPPSYPIITAPAILAEHIASPTHAPVPEVQAALNDAVDSQGAPESFRIS